MQYVSSVIGSVLHVPIFMVGFFPQRLYTLIDHALLAPFRGIRRNRYNFEEVSKAKVWGHLTAWWATCLITKSLDLTGIWALADVGFSIAKPNSRRLSELEEKEARKVFGSSLPYEAIRIDERSLFARWGAKFAKKSQLGMVTFRTVNFTRELSCEAGNSDMGWLIHELVHVRQMQALGAQYMIEALYAQKTSGYSYGGFDALQERNDYVGFNLEQQADICRHYYSRSLYGDLDSSVYEPYILQMREGEF